MSEHHDAGPGSPFIVVLTAAADELATHCGLGSGLDPVLGEGSLERIFADPATVPRIFEEFKTELASVDAVE